MAQVIDAMFAEGVTTESLAMEMALRSLCGVIFATQNGNPELLNQLEWNPPGAAIPKELAHQVIKRATRAAASAAKAKTKSPGGGKPRPGKDK